MEFVIDTIRMLFFSIDKIVYGLIDDVYSLLLQLARTSIFSQSAIHQFSERVYALVGIFMLFKVSVSLINYVLNPDDFTDKDKGFSSIVKHVILALVLIVLVPYIFNEAFELQSIILEENTIMNVVFGSPASRDSSMPKTSNSSYAESAGQKIQFTVAYAFAQPNYEEFFNDSKYDLADCQETYDTIPSGQEGAGDYKFRQKPTFGSESGGKSQFIYELRPSCWGVYDSESDTYSADGENGQLASLFEDNDYEIIYQNYAQGVAQQSFNMFFIKDVMRAKEQGVENARYLVNYKFGISTAVGVGVIYLLLMFCIDIAVRSVKLGFLQMIAPIPILSYVDPKSGKDGMFKKWTDMCVKTYLELFMRLFALYFGIYVISLVGTFRDVVTGEIVSGWTVSIFMIIGILIFVKKLPEILKEVLNIKSDGKFTFNPLKKLENDAIGGKFLAGAGKKAVGLAKGVGAAGLVGTAGLVTGQGFRLGAMGKAVAGGFRGDKFGKNFASSYGAARARRKQIDEMRDDGVSPLAVELEKARNVFRGQSPAEHIKAVSGGLKAIQDDYAQYEKVAAGVDKIAKDLDKRRKAAEAAGDYEATKKWSDAFDARVKQIAQNKGRIVTNSEGFTINEHARKPEDMFSFTADATYADNAALQNLASHMAGLASEMNKNAAHMDGYQRVEVEKTADGGLVNIKDVKNQAQGSQQSIDTNAATRHANDMDKYTGGTKKK